MPALVLGDVCLAVAAEKRPDSQSQVDACPRGTHRYAREGKILAPQGPRGEAEMTCAKMEVGLPHLVGASNLVRSGRNLAGRCASLRTVAEWRWLRDSGKNDDPTAI